jgi:hypothetical protein
MRNILFLTFANLLRILSLWGAIEPQCKILRDLMWITLRFLPTIRVIPIREHLNVNVYDVWPDDQGVKALDVVLERQIYV